MIQVCGTFFDQPINGAYQVESSGKVPLGPAYGTPQLNGLTFLQAEKALEEHLKKILNSPEVSVSMASFQKVWRDAAAAKPPHRIAPGDLLDVRVTGTFMGQPIDGTYRVEAGGTVPLGWAYGRAQLAGKTFREAEIALEKYLTKVLRSPAAAVTLGGWRTEDRTAATSERR